MSWQIFWRWLLDLGWLIFLLYMFLHFWQNRRRLLVAQSWLKTTGRITSCKWTKVGHSVWPKIEYTYQVNDTDLIGHYLYLDTTHNNPNSKYSRRIAYKVAIAFQEGSDIDVYYNPNHPEQSALDIAIPVKLNVILIVIIGLIILHLGTVFFRYFSI